MILHKIKKIIEQAYLILSMDIMVSKILDKKALENAFYIRNKVFVIEQGVSEKEEYDEFESSSVHFLVTANGLPVGTARWRKTDNGIKLERFAILSDYRKLGLGATLVHAILKDLLVETQHVYLHAQVHAVPFYASLGFIIEGSEFEEAGIRHLKMYLRSPNKE